MEDSEKAAIRAAFSYMGPRTQAGLTLEALAKGAGVLIGFKDDEIEKLRAANQRLSDGVETVADALEAERRKSKILTEAINGALKMHDLSGCQTTCWFPKDLLLAVLYEHSESKPVERSDP